MCEQEFSQNNTLGLTVYLSRRAHRFPRVRGERTRRPVFEYYIILRMEIPICVSRKKIYVSHKHSRSRVVSFILFEKREMLSVKSYVKRQGGRKRRCAVKGEDS